MKILSIFQIFLRTCNLQGYKPKRRNSHFQNYSHFSQLPFPTLTTKKPSRPHWISTFRLLKTSTFFTFFRLLSLLFTFFYLLLQCTLLIELECLHVHLYLFLRLLQFHPKFKTPNQATQIDVFPTALFHSEIQLSLPCPPTSSVLPSNSF